MLAEVRAFMERIGEPVSQLTDGRFMTRGNSILSAAGLLDVANARRLARGEPPFTSQPETSSCVV